MILGKAFGKYLRDELGIDSLKVTRLKKVFKTGYLQSIAINMLIYNYGLLKKEEKGWIVSEEEKVKILAGNGEAKTNYVTSKGGEIKIKEEIVPLEPQFIIDLGLFKEHTEEEKISLLEQIKLTLVTIRHYLSDLNLKLFNKPEFFSLEVKNKVYTINQIPKEKTIVLNPYGDIIANESIILNSKFFIIGGIVDKGRRYKNATTLLAKKYGYDDLPQVKITLRGSIVGVPDRINKIVEIVLNTITGSSLEDAIILSQSNADKLNRLVTEINKMNELNLEKARELASWLKVDQRILNFALRKSKFKNQSISS
ncbi:tRNA (guanine-N1)-methyltransferase [Sulfolobus sp. A20]|uniref:tRNA (adenine(9)-N1)-methyltransferase Trm10 n=1 Tax=Sulfolobaceae TaxID=118883 RepID=UPI000845D5AB|nr:MULTISPECIES: tRNA (adenine(9)-N1)-methyltransferase Trm10 [unclassified Sulfolobus]TRM76181.1 tRNA (guanine-N1)-methyltransferase [Sulfolobus sp. E5]TRM77024.1 tRNA (guanine-N1)-methyltransferase [Sulfolobus sp. A20-N-F8]TRM79238.1 tRNA (guanine-N1)-methyltransferase [Sulfolobus sp. B5]TRM81530.1 tRNA (guanine-N1)-methyltransferase [Sulfolobus sp. D5]TRM83767.1 tRNA (guanine-N1)-methyltransferase [Sulfolobus sp. A20-N-F6]TRM86876.1 tRNA (guanine-N1)-methyltransferase [Sulfolobus sp. E3]T